jgi:chemotaxis protein MotB
VKKGIDIRTTSTGASWIITFADLMTLLLTFFILLLSFSNLDAEKYRNIAYSMSQAFGVSWAPQSLVIPEIATAIVISPAASVGAVDSNTDLTAPQINSPAVVIVKEAAPMTIEQSQQQLAAAALRQNDALATVLINKLEQQVADKALNVSYDSKGVIISFTERASFPSGSVELRQYMRPVLLKVVDELAKCTGDVLVMGHTDDRPMDSGRYRSNWDLSAARAVSVVHQLILDGRLDARRVKAVGLAETQPLVPNDSDENRAVNRRVEVLIENAVCDFMEPSTSV